MSNPNAILGILSDLYEQISQLAQENAALRQALAEKPTCPPASTDDLDGLYRPRTPERHTHE